MSKTVVGLFNTTAQAQKVKDTLIADGFSASDIKIVDNTVEGSSEGTGIGQKISNFFGSLTGSDETTHQEYTDGVSQGGALLSVDAEADEAEEVAATLKEYGARDLDGGYSSQASAGTPVYGQTSASATSSTGEVIPVVAEELVVGKREVDRGGVRVYSRVVEQPVSADVTLRDEFVNVERRVVDRPATAADFQSGAAAIEVRATGEEAVVGKTSRVVEEIVVGKETSHRTEAIHDTVRNTEVEVEDLTTTATTGSTGTTTNRY